MYVASAFTDDQSGRKPSTIVRIVGVMSPLATALAYSDGANCTAITALIITC